VPEVVCTFARPEGWDKFSDASMQGSNGSGGELSQLRFEFAERHLDRIEVRGVFGQIPKCRPLGLYGFANTADLVNRKIVHDDDVIPPECGDQTLFDIGEKGFAVHCAFDDHRRRHSSPAQPRYKSCCVPVSKRNAANQPFPTQAAPAQPCHLRIGRCLVDEDQMGRVKQALALNPKATRQSNVRPFSFGCVQCFF